MKQKKEKAKKYEGITELFFPIFKTLDKWVKKNYHDTDKPLHDVVLKIQDICRTQSISVGLDESDLYDLRNGKEIKMHTNGVDVSLFKKEL